jgi:hypothetical protein
MILRLDDDALSGPLPELSLGCPELLGIATDYQGRVLALLSLFFLFFLFAQICSSFPLNQFGLGWLTFTTTVSVCFPALDDRRWRAIWSAAAS